jgi:hypothetical protein
MSDLPDLDTSQISFIAYFNAIDQGGVQSIDPTEVTNHGNVQSYTLYDNGVQGVYTTATGRDCAFRVKEDGWFVAYLNRYENFNNGENGNQDDVRGPWDLLNNWVDYNSTDDITSNSLERCINALKGELSNSGSVTYSASDVGLYDYRHPSAAGITALSDWGEDYSGSTYSQSPGFQYTSGTTVHWAAAASSVHAAWNDFDNDGGEGDVKFNGTQVAYVDNYNSPDYGYDGPRTNYGSIDLISRGLIPSADTEYTGQTYFRTVGGNYAGAEGTLTCLLVWE